MSTIAGLPRLAITLDGAPLAREAAPAITGIRVQERLGLPALCEVTLAESLMAQRPDAAWRLGGTLRIELADEADLLFAGEITAIGHSHSPGGERTIQVRGYDPLHRLRKREAARAFVDVTADSLAADLVQDLGLGVSAETPGPRWPLLIQHRQTDFDLLAEVCSRAGLFPIVVNGDLLRLASLGASGILWSLLWARISWKPRSN
jgi:uncharacterized protein involved in type VI secretion and phage assembly